MVVPVMWRTQKQRYALQAATCPHCTSAVFPPRAVCPYCKQPMAVRAAKPAQAHSFVLPAPVPAAQPQPALVAGDD